MSDAEFHAQYAARKAHMAAVPVAVAEAKALIDAFAKAPPSPDAPYSAAFGTILTTLVAEIERLQAQVLQQQKDAREEQREFQREARDIAADATWAERERNDHGGY